MIFIWKKYFVIEMIKVLTLFIGCIYFFYILFDYTSHTKLFQNEQISLLDIFFYYLFQFTHRADIFISVALMLATIKVLTTSQMRFEIVALASGGISLKKILRPFLGIALLCACLLYINFQFLQPYSMSWINSFEERFFDQKTLNRKQVKSLILKDNSLLIYKSFDSQSQAFFDVFWLKTEQQFFRIKFLYPFEKNPFGKCVDSLVRTSKGDIMKLTSYENHFFTDMHFEKKDLYRVVHPPNMQSITQLAHNLESKHVFYSLNKMSDREAETVTYFCYKLTLPFVCLLAVIGPAPFCLRFTRNLPTFLIYALSLCSIITFFTFVSAGIILGESQVIPPLLAILFPKMLFFVPLGVNYAKL